MEVDTILAQVSAAGITLSVQDGRLRYRPADRMTPELAAAIRPHKAAIMARLSEEDVPGKRENVKTSCVRCGRALGLPESLSLGVCFGCMTEPERIDTMARMSLRQERIKAAVAARKADLREEGAA